MTSDKSVMVDIPVERAILAAILLEGGQPGDPFNWLAAIKSEMFFDSFHRKVFEIAKSLVDKGQYADVLTVSAQFPKGQNIQAKLLDIQSSIASTAEMETWIKILKDRWARREISTRCHAALEAASDVSRPVSELCGDIERSLSEVGSGAVDNAALTAQDVIVASVEEMQADVERLKSNIESSRRIKMCIPWLDGDIFVERGDVLVLCAYQGHGKTSLALQLLRAQLSGGLKDAYFCTETKATALAKKLMASMGGVSYRDAIEPRDPLKIAKIFKGAKDLKRFKDNFALWGSVEVQRDLDSVIYLARQAKARLGGIDTVYIDHLHDFKLPREFRNAKRTRDEGIGENVQKCKQLAGQLDCAVVLLAQLDKASRQEKRPGASALRGSSVIVDVASTILFLYNTHKAGTEYQSQQEVELYSDKSRDEMGFFKKLVFDGPTREFRPAGWSATDRKYGKEDLPDGCK